MYPSIPRFVKFPYLSSLLEVSLSFPCNHLLMQGLSDAAGSEVRVSFTPHLMCMSR